MVQDQLLTIAALIRDNWDNTNTSEGSDPTVHTGKYREDQDNPQVAVTRVAEVPRGESGYTAADASGSGGVQERDGLLDVSCWDDYGRNDDAKKLVWEMAEEVHRIVMANQHQATDLRLIFPAERRGPLAEDDETPVKLQLVQEVGYILERRP